MSAASSCRSSRQRTSVAPEHATKSTGLGQQTQYRTAERMGEIPTTSAEKKGRRASFSQLKCEAESEHSVELEKCTSDAKDGSPEDKAPNAPATTPQASKQFKRFVISSIDIYSL